MNFTDKLDFCNPLNYELWRGDRCIDKGECLNGITNEGKNTLLDVYFNGDTPETNWWIGIVDSDSFTGFASNDTMASHGGWVEWVDTSNGGRIDWAQGAASGQQVTNAVVLSVTITANGTLQGVFIVSDGTFGGTIGVLWATALFTTPLIAEAGDVLKLTYAVQL